MHTKQIKGIVLMCMVFKMSKNDDLNDDCECEIKITRLPILPDATVCMLRLSDR